MLSRLKRFGRFRLLFTLCAALLLGACTQVTSPADAPQIELGALAAQSLTFEVEALGVPHRAGGTHRAVRDARCSNRTCMRFGAAQPGASIVYRLAVPRAGRYAVQVRVKKGPDGGTFRLSTAEAGGFSGRGREASLYAPQTAYTTLSFGDVTFGSAGSKRFSFAVSGKDARSAGQALTLDSIILTAEGTAPSTGTAPSGGAWTALFNGQNLDGWYTYLPSKGKNRDPQEVFKVSDGMLHILDLPGGERQEFGYLATRTSYRDYHLRLEYRWGDKRFAPRTRLKRDSGIVYHITGGDKVWPRGAELQIQEGDTGDLWLLGGTTASTTVASTTANPKRYREGGTPYTTRAGSFVRVAKDQTRDRRSGWNTVELIAVGDTVTHLVNGAVVHRAERLRGAGGGPLDGGRIALQAEGAEISYRNIEIRPVAAEEERERERGRTGGRQVLFDGGDSDAWRPKNSGGRRWAVTNGALEVAPGNRVGQNDLRTRETYRDFKLHLEFQVPDSPRGTPEQGRGNSGVYLQGRYEVQILDSYGRTLSGKDDAGAIYGVRDARRNVSRPAGAWQSYDITFRAARYAGGKKIAPARMTVVWNGTLVHQGVAVPRPTRLGAPEGPSAGPIVLQDHGKRVRYRNIWIEPLD